MNLHTTIEEGNEALRDEVTRLMFLATSEDDPSLVPATLLQALHLSYKRRPALTRFLFHLRRRMRDLDDFRPLLLAAHEQTVERALKRMTFDLSALAGAVVQTPSGPAIRTQAVGPEWEQPYLRALATACSELRLSGLQASQADPTKEKLVKLDAVYIDLEVDTQVSVVKNKDGSERIIAHDELERLASRRGALRDDAQTRRMTALEAISLDQTKRLVLLGEPGGGKTTFVRHLALRLALMRLPPDDAPQTLRGWTLDALMPVHVVLRDVVAWLDKMEKRNQRPEPVTQTLLDFMQDDWREHSLAHVCEPLQQYLQTQGGLLLLDGLDEVPDYEKYRGFVKTLVENFARDYPLCRIVVTSRPYAYQDKYRRWQLQGFGVQRLALFSDEQISRFVQRWYDAVAPSEGLSADDARARATSLIHATREQPHLAELAAYPLLLTLMATLHTAQNTLPENRADLYDQCVQLLLERWEQRKQTADTETSSSTISSIGRDCSPTAATTPTSFRTAPFKSSSPRGTC
ncbi:MAG: NACHT domain-containing protein [Verrucomicrobia bacterium]|nr:NACHT domain-containing protein [Verrucomicrobiota bacterium]